MSDAADPRRPVLILSGFLGSGKTTLLNRLLKSPMLADSAVLINEFGEIGIDHQLVMSVDENIVVLESGCICCTIREDLKSALLDLENLRASGALSAFKRIVIETTGIADPAPILHTLTADPLLQFHFRAVGIITTVDACHAAYQLDTFEEVTKQVLLADALIITKSDLVDAAICAALTHRLAALNPLSRCFDANAPDFDVARLLEVSSPRDPFLPPDAAHNQLGHATHTAALQTFCLTETQPVDWTTFGVWLTLLLRAHGTRVLRVKGLLNVAGLDVPVVINGVQHIVHPPFHLPAWPDEDHRSRIVFIVRGLAREQIESSFHRFRAVGLRLAAADFLP